MRRTPALAVLVALVLPAARPAPASAVEVLWEASSGAPPDSSCPSWIRSASVPVTLGSGALTISTTVCSNSVAFGQQGDSLVIPDSLVVEARLRVEARGECVGPCGHYRDAAGISIAVAPQVGTLFFVGLDQIFLTNGECAGITSAAVDTDGSAHTYRVTVRAGGAVTVHYDGSPILTGHTYTSLSDHGTTTRIWWGEGSFLAYGTSHWEWVRHNAHATGCVPTSVAEGLPPAAGDGGSRSSGVIAWPNPSNDGATIVCTIARAGRVTVEIYDVAGRLVRDLVDAGLPAGEHRFPWDGLDAAGRTVRPGSYVYRITGPDGASSGKILRLP